MGRLSLQHFSKRAECAWFLPACALLCLGFLAGCTARQCTGDPRTDSLSCASRGISSGRYERNTSAIARDVAETERELARKQQTYDRLQTRLDILKSKRRELLETADRLDQRLNALQETGRVSRAMITELRRRLDDINARSQAVLEAEPPRLLNEPALTQAENQLEEDQSAIAMLSQQVAELTEGYIIR